MKERLGKPEKRMVGNHCIEPSKRERGRERERERQTDRECFFYFLIRRRNIKEQEKMIRKIFDNLIGLDHPNIVKFHKYWTEMAEANMEKPRVVSLGPKLLAKVNDDASLTIRPNE